MWTKSASSNKSCTWFITIYFSVDKPSEMAQADTISMIIFFSLSKKFWVQQILDKKLLGPKYLSKKKLGAKKISSNRNVVKRNVVQIIKNLYF